jgi:hypothetical protein
MLRCKCLHSDVRAAAVLHGTALRATFLYRGLESQGISDTETYKHKQVINSWVVFMLGGPRSDGRIILKWTLKT